MPARLGPTVGSTAYLDAWRQMPVGVDRKALLTDLYPPEVIDLVERGPHRFTQWTGNLVGASLPELPVAVAVQDATLSAVAPQDALDRAATTLREIQATLPGGGR